MNKEEKQEVRTDIKQYVEIEVISKTIGGKAIIKNLKLDIITSIEKLMLSYQTATHIELISYCAELKEKFTMYKMFMSAPNQKKIAKEYLEELLKTFPEE